MTLDDQHDQLTTDKYFTKEDTEDAEFLLRTPAQW